MLEAPRQILFAQQHAARGEAIDEMKADGIEYEERMVLLEQVTWPQPLAELLEATYEIYRESHPWLDAEDLLGAQVGRAGDVRAGDGVHRLRRPLPAGPVRGAGAALPHRRLPDAPPDRARSAHRTPELEDLVEWLGETVRQTDSSLLDEWEALTDPGARRPRRRRAGAHRRRPPRPISAQDRPFRVMVRNAMWRRVELVARDDVDGLMALERAAADRPTRPLEVAMTRVARGTRRSRPTTPSTTEVRLDADARGPDAARESRSTGRTWRVRQTLTTPRATTTG